MKQEEMEMQLWEYIDGCCNDADRQRISLLIATDITWKEKFRELGALQESITGSLELEQPSMRFARNVMDTVSTVQVARSAKQRINLSVIRGIAAFFVLVIATALTCALATAKWNSGTETFFPGLNLTGLFSGGILSFMICANIVLGLAFVDIFIRRNRSQKID